MEELARHRLSPLFFLEDFDLDSQTLIHNSLYKFYTLSLSLSHLPLISLPLSLSHLVKLRVVFIDMGSKKVVIKIDLHDDKDKQKAMRVVSRIPGIDAITIEMKDSKMTLIGDIDPINVVAKLRKYWLTEIAFVGPAKEPEKKKDDPNKKKDGGGGGDNKKKENEVVQYNPYIMPYYPHIVSYNPQMNYPQHVPQQYYPHMAPSYYAHSHEENPNGCVIC